MKRVFAGFALAVAVTFGTVAFAQSTGNPPVQSQPPATAQAPAQAEQKAPAEQVTVEGCIQKESDYRKARNLGAGGAVGTGAGAGDEFILINAMKVTATGTTAAGTATGTAATGTGGTPRGTATGGTGAPAEGDAFELSGDKEESLKDFIGKRVRITGTMKAAEKTTAGATGGKTAGTPPTGVDVASADLRLREIDVISVMEATTGTCPATMK